MKKSNLINYKDLRQTLDPNQLDFKTTAELETLTEFVGQERALESIYFGIGIKSHGYNLYAMGPSGIGKRSLIRSILETKASKQPTPFDWCYIHNFEIPEKPISLRLPPGMGLTLQQDMKILVEELGNSILGLFESDEYRIMMQEINKEFNMQRKSCDKDATTCDEEIPHLYKERHEKEKAMLLRFSTTLVEPHIIKLKNKYAKLGPVITYLNAVQKDAITHATDFIYSDEKTNVLVFDPLNSALIKYQVNLLVSHGTKKGAPVIFEENPSYSNLICRVEHISQLGTLVTNFTLIRAGALHKANGGYLILEARKLKKATNAWEALKRALYSRIIRIEPVEHLEEAVRPISLEPISIPLDVKIILLGDRTTYYSFCNHDPDFSELFKVAVDFDEQIERNKKNIKLYARLIGTIAKREGVRPFQSNAVAAIIDHSSRLAEDINKLSTHIRNIDDLILESNYWASLTDKTTVDATDVKRAINAQIHRIDRSREQYYEDINRNFILIDTHGEAIGQTNCLSVVKVGNFSYGHPTRLTANVRIGKGKIIDIQREIDMAGPMLTKGGLIISNFIASYYNQHQPFSLSASISFEQIYGEIDGDSASIAELCVILSALSDAPIKQYLAVTGSANQFGEVQAVGGVNAKIEGFYDICHTRGLNGRQGVLIPSSNLKNLMLREEVVDAVKKKKFFIYQIEDVAQAITLLTGIPAGKRNSKGVFPKDTINYLVEKRLQEYADRANKRMF